MAGPPLPAVPFDLTLDFLLVGRVRQQGSGVRREQALPFSRVNGLWEQLHPVPSWPCWPLSSSWGDDSHLPDGHRGGGAGQGLVPGGLSAARLGGNLRFLGTVGLWPFEGIHQPPPDFWLLSHEQTPQLQTGRTAGAAESGRTVWGWGGLCLCPVVWPGTNDWNLKLRPHELISKTRVITPVWAGCCGLYMNCCVQCPACPRRTQSPVQGRHWPPSGPLTEALGQGEAHVTRGHGWQRGERSWGAMAAVVP